MKDVDPRDSQVDRNKLKFYRREKSYCYNYTQHSDSAGYYSVSLHCYVYTENEIYLT